MLVEMGVPKCSKGGKSRDCNNKSMLPPWSGFTLAFRACRCEAVHDE